MNRAANDLVTAVTATLAPVDDLTALADNWRQLEQQAECSFFLSWGWLGPWAKLIGERTQLYLYTCRAQQTIVGLAFFTLRRTARRRGAVRSTQLQLNEWNAPRCDMIIEYNGILSARGFEQACWEALPSAIATTGLRWDEFTCRSLTANQLAFAQMAFSDLRCETDRAPHAWVIPLPIEKSDEEKLLTLFKRKTRQQMRQSLREYEKLGAITIDIADSTAQAIDFFAEMESHHSARWQKVGRSGSFANELWRRFHDEVIREGFPRGEIQLVRVCCAGAPIGYIYAYPWRGHLYALQTGFKPEQSTALRSGYVTHFKAMQHNAERGITRYDFLPDESHSYKRLLAEPEGVLATVRFQRNRLKFLLERLACVLHSRLQVRQKSGTATTADRDD